MATATLPSLGPPGLAMVYCRSIAGASASSGGRLGVWLQSHSCCASFSWCLCEANLLLHARNTHAVPISAPTYQEHTAVTKEDRTKCCQQRPAARPRRHVHHAAVVVSIQSQYRCCCFIPHIATRDTVVVAQGGPRSLLPCLRLSTRSSTSAAVLRRETETTRKCICGCWWAC